MDLFQGWFFFVNMSVVSYVTLILHRRSAQYARTHVRNMRKKLFYDKVALT